MESLDTFDLYEGELNLLKTEEDLLEFLTDMHEELCLTDLSDLLRYYEDEDNFEYAIVVRDFAIKNRIHH